MLMSYLVALSAQLDITYSTSMNVYKLYTTSIEPMQPCTAVYNFLLRWRTLFKEAKPLDQIQCWTQAVTSWYESLAGTGRLLSARRNSVLCEPPHCCAVGLVLLLCKEYLVVCP